MLSSYLFLKSTMSHHSPHSQSEKFASTTGTFNAGRRVPPPRSLPHPSSARDRQTHSSSMDNSVSSTTLKIGHQEFRDKVVIRVDEATEPGTPDEEAARYRKDIASFILGRNVPRMPKVPSGTNSGKTVVHALRKRLKSHDIDAVLNTLVLLDELMRTVPYFYRYVADDRFFRRLWRFVDHNYKNQVMSFLKHNRSKASMYMGSFDSEVAERVKILIRAWAVDLSTMFPGQVDAKAGYLIERYNKKKTRMTFPEVPKTDTPWVCPISPKSTNRRLHVHSRGESSSSSTSVETWTLDELENTVILFNSLVDSASTVDDVKGELCGDLAARCRRIGGNLSQITMNMNDEADLARAVSISEMVQSSLDKYNVLLQGGNPSNINRDSNKIVTIPSDDEPDSYSSDEDDRTSSSFRRIRLRSDEGAASDSARSNIQRSNSMGSAPNVIPTSSRAADIANEHRFSEASEWTKALDERDSWNRIDELDHQDNSERDSTSRHDRSHGRNHSREFLDETSARRTNNRGRGRELEDFDSDDVSDSSDSSHSRERKLRTTKQKPKGSTGKRIESSSRSKGRDFKRNQKSSPPRTKTSVEKSRMDDSDEATQAETLISIYTDETKKGKGEDKTRRKRDSHKKKKERPRDANDDRKPPVKSVEGNNSNPAMANIGSSSGSVGNASNVHPFIPSYGMNNFMVPPNPLALYSSMNSPGVLDPMKMYQAYTTVNPTAYYSNMNPVWNPMAFNPMNPYNLNMSSMSMMGPPPASQMPGGAGNIYRQGTAPTIEAERTHNVVGDNGNSNRDSYSSQRSALESPHSGVGMPQNPSTSWSAPVPASDIPDVSNGIGPQGMTKQEAEMRAAEYHSTMQHAAAMYQLAESGYRTMQGHAAIAQSPNLSNSQLETPESSKATDSQTHDKQE